jgi:GDP-4-dehydro-6-deoxy-D-mannose reductase
VRTLVTGAAGFVASHLLDRLIRLGDPVIGWTRPGGRTPEWTPPPDTGGGAAVTWVGVDLLDREQVARAVAAAQPSRIYHLAGATHPGKAWTASIDALRTNALGTHHLLEALARHRPASRVLVTGTGYVYRPSPTAVDEQAPLGPSSPYGFSKLAQEMVARHAASTSPVEVVVCRPFNHIGPRQTDDYFASSFARQIARIARGHGPPVLRVGNLTARRDLTDVRDVVAAYVSLMEKGEAGAIYNVCSGRAHMIRGILDGLIAQSGVNVEVEVNPELLRPVDQPLLMGNPAKLTRATEWTPTIPLERTLADLLADWAARDS